MQLLLALGTWVALFFVRVLTAVPLGLITAALYMKTGGSNRQLFHMLQGALCSASAVLGVHWIASRWIADASVSRLAGAMTILGIVSTWANRSDEAKAQGGFADQLGGAIAAAALWLSGASIQGPP
ncbi:MAG: hypothetical protein HOP15_18880 [Planctomycetes bacterium]|nr:hypothetical protein [Planctomycetota bacterium]